MLDADISVLLFYIQTKKRTASIGWIGYRRISDGSAQSDDCIQILRTCDIFSAIACICIILAMERRGLEK